MLLAHARNTPQEIAVADLTEAWTFADVAQRASALADRLEATGQSGPVGLLSDRHLASVAAAYGGLWAGRGVVICDAHDPQPRLIEMFERAGVTTVVDATGKAAAQLGSWDVLRYDARTDDRAELSPLRPVEPEAWATVQFTSGSTGRPKGVAKSFRRLDSSLEVFAPTGYLGPVPTAVFTPLHFSGGFAPIVSGMTSGRLRLLINPVEDAPTAIVAALKHYEIERLAITPSFLRVFLQAFPAAERLEHLRSVWCVGEPTLWGDVALVRRVLGEHLTVSAAYGATEALGWRCVNTIGPDTPLGDGRVPLGLPVGEDVIRVEYDGATEGIGELIYRGDLADGYFDDPELQAERFGIDPDGVRIWRSGDLVSVDESGVLHHRGRVDDMVKINGKLVEPAEVESALRTVDGVSAAVVLPRVNDAGKHQLVAHIEADETVNVAAVRATLSDRLPAHLVPARVVRHDRFPLTDRGKVDRAALAVAENPAPAESTASTTPALPNPDDMLLVTVLATARRLIDANLGVDDNIWDAGCDSLTAIQLLIELETDSSVDLDPALLVSISSCRDLAEYLRSGQRRKRSNVVVLNAGRPGPWLVLVAGAGGFSLNYRPLANEIGDAVPIVIYEQRGLHRRGRRDRSIDAMAERCVEDLRSRQPTGPYLITGHSWGGLVAQAMANRLTAAGERVTLVLLDSARHPRNTALRPVLPERIRHRADPWPVWAAKCAVWGLAYGRRQLVLRFRRSVRRVGTVDRYQAFYRFALKTARGYHAPVIDIPVVLITPTGSGYANDWDDHPNLRKVEAGGDHHSMLLHPHVQTVATVLSELRDGSPSTAR